MWSVYRALHQCDTSKCPVFLPCGPAQTPNEPRPTVASSAIRPIVVFPHAATLIHWLDQLCPNPHTFVHSVATWHRAASLAPPYLCPTCAPLFSSDGRLTSCIRI